MSGSQFSITSVTGRGFRFVKDETPYLSRLAALPVGVNFLTQMLLSFISGPTPTQFDLFILTLPCAVVNGRFMFQIARLIILGEREGQLPADPAYRLERRRLLQASVLCWLVVNAGFTVIVGYQEWLARQDGMNHGAMSLAADGPFGGQGALYNAIGLLLIGAGVWAVRFWVVHILAAVDFPIRKYIFDVNGIGISLRLLGLGLLIGLPAFFLYILIGEMAGPGPSPNPVAIGIVVFLSAMISAYVTALLTAASCYALRDMLGRKDLAA